MQCDLSFLKFGQRDSATECGSLMTFQTYRAYKEGKLSGVQELKLEYKGKIINLRRVILRFIQKHQQNTNYNTDKKFKAEEIRTLKDPGTISEVLVCILKCSADKHRDFFPI